MNAQRSRPQTRIDPVRKTVGSVTFDDPYAWLQDDSAEALAWQWEQDAMAQRHAQSLPQFERLKAAILEQGSPGESFLHSPPRRLGGRWFWTAPSANSPIRAMWVGDTPEGPGRVLVESAQLAARSEDAPSAMVNWFEPSPNAQFVAACVTAGGEMKGVWRVIEVATGRVLDLTIPATAYTGALPGWLPDASGFYLNDRAPDGRHRLRFIPVKPGTAARPDAVFDFSDVPANVSGLTPELSPDGRWVVGLAGPHERIACVLGDLRTGEWRRFLPQGYHGECSGAWADNDTYVARVHGGTTPRGRVVAIPVATSSTTTTWRELVPQSEAVLRAVTIVQERLVVADLEHVSARFRLFDLDGRNERLVPVQGPGTSFVTMLLRRFDRSEELTFEYWTFTRRVTRYHCDVRTSALEVLGEPGREERGITVTQRFATSLDGTRIPYFLIHRDGLDLSRPQSTLVNGYGGFNVAWLPMYLAHLVPFVRAGGVVAHANLRGGADYGRDWHEAGRLACKWNTFLDLFAVAEHLIEGGVTRSDLLAMNGGSNGGLLAGAAIAHRPDLFRVVVPVVPIFDQMEPLPADPQYDPVRSIFFEDYGDPSHPIMSKVLFSYSPYHNIREGVSYPAVYQVFGEKDLGCMPFHGRKFTARLQAASDSGRPVLLRVWKNTGHGSADTDTATTQAAEWLAFVMDELGMKLADRDA